MNAALALLLLGALALGCARARPASLPTEAREPKVARPTPSSPAPPPAVSVPRESPPAGPVLAPSQPQASPARLPNEEQVTREVTARLEQTRRTVDKIQPERLARDQREMLASVRDFMAKAHDALQARDLSRAQILVDKAARLADDLVVALKNSR